MAARSVANSDMRGESSLRSAQARRGQERLRISGNWYVSAIILGVLIADMVMNIFPPSTWYVRIAGDSMAPQVLRTRDRA
ncbi:MAG: hypothetical protein AUI53_03175 [Acidobacteria bacterium 13_1_40CM_2_60_7]|nr:MAG: hypothetical protein AUI53_03175 [Acidobacteria bacterium 13_1_40CM_2_60_7]OLE85796.1 MAG: hypothetical protein AUG07_03680 [Acidobacteria bacterium 13_1_20CM_2_60_10]PYU04828.1 MAG: hypothetical protein DMG33_12945 [Acidobacteriota bacterium]